MNGVECFINVLLVIFIFWILYLATRQEVPEKERLAKEHFYCPMAYRNFQLMRTYPELKYRYSYY